MIYLLKKCIIYVHTSKYGLFNIVIFMKKTVVSFIMKEIRKIRISEGISENKIINIEENKSEVVRIYMLYSSSASINL